MNMISTEPVDHEVDEIRFNLDFNTGDKQSAAFVSKLIVGSNELATDFNLNDPEDATSEKKAVAILERTMWSGAPGDDVILRGYVNLDGRGAINNALRKRNETAKVEVVFTCYEFANEDKGHYIYFDTEEKGIKGSISKNGVSGALNKAVDYEGTTLYPFTLNISGNNEGGQTLVVCDGPGNNVVLPWGQKQG